MLNSLKGSKNVGQIHSCFGLNGEDHVIKLLREKLYGLSYSGVIFKNSAFSVDLVKVPGMISRSTGEFRLRDARVMLQCISM